MTKIQRSLALLAALTLLVFGCIEWGKHLVQVEWDKEKAIREALIHEDALRNTKNIADLRKQFEKEKAHAESEAGKRAIDRYLRDHGLLQPADPGQAKVPQGADGAACESGLAERLADFAAKCVDDARRVKLCTDWAIREGLVAE